VFDFDRLWGFSAVLFFFSFLIWAHVNYPPLLANLPMFPVSSVSWVPSDSPFFLRKTLQRIYFFFLSRFHGFLFFEPCPTPLCPCGPFWLLLLSPSFFDSDSSSERRANPFPLSGWDCRVPRSLGYLFAKSLAFFALQGFGAFLLGFSDFFFLSGPSPFLFPFPCFLLPTPPDFHSGAMLFLFFFRPVYWCPGLTGPLRP